MNALVFLFTVFFSSAVMAAEPQVIVKCFGSSPKFPNPYFELFLNEEGKLSSAYTMGRAPIYYPTWTTAGQVTTPPARFVSLLQNLNAFRDTGIDPNKVKFFQNIFVDGSNTFAVEMWKLMDEQQNLLGWVAHAYRELIGCY
jgi:hypothetical protein